MPNNSFSQGFTDYEVRLEGRSAGSFFEVELMTEIKLPSDPESTKVDTVSDKPAAVSVTWVKKGEWKILEVVT